MLLLPLIKIVATYWDVDTSCGGPSTFSGLGCIRSKLEARDVQSCIRSWFRFQTPVTLDSVEKLMFCQWQTVFGLDQSVPKWKDTPSTRVSIACMPVSGSVGWITAACILVLVSIAIDSKCFRAVQAGSTARRQKICFFVHYFRNPERVLGMHY